MSLTCLLYLPLLCLTYLLLGGLPWLRILSHTLPRDLFIAYTYSKINIEGDLMAKKNVQLHHIWLEIVAKNRTKTAITCGERKISFEEMNLLINKIANYFVSLGVTKSDTVALYSENRIEYVCIWLAFSKLGVITALINNNLRGKSLVHSVRVASCKMVIFTPATAAGACDIYEEMREEVTYHCLGAPTEDVGFQFTDILIAAEHCQDTEPAVGNLNVKSIDPVFYIYTSGTTGMPKACKFTHIKYRNLVYSIHKLLRLNSDDVIYNVLPLYHTNGNVLAMGQTLLFGCENVLRLKFSASQFWSECSKHSCTVCIYIGELCRYLLAQPAKSVDSTHKIRLAYGNGLKPNIWRAFQTRFNIDRIGEFYGATEGNANIINNTNQEGCVGYSPITFTGIPGLNGLAFPVLLIKLDQDTGEVIRDADRTCVMCKPGEPGELIGRITNKIDRRFDGYVNSEATTSKIIRDVEQPGDRFFRTGDILVQDDYGYFRFCDRGGDTFRWKGENVSTAEVESIIASVLNLKDVAVYGVEIPGTDGKAGMAAIADPELDPSTLYKEISSSLPVYARPIFIRLIPSVDMTGTFKLQKKKLKEEGFDISKIPYQLFYLDTKLGLYVELNKEAYDGINTGSIRV
ncbi:hypothetical protein LOD99_10582 [Oopsacas minuta]|uniref:Very long-chain fatty acid transport protein n=1 Tax=Oopsacas minuta TaxID=111878 RepID=A0AAV7KIW4_9METZ|nr:hypothetical protein LOD99_10582 [Oopsacas minuta]